MEKDIILKMTGDLYIRLYLLEQRNNELTSEIEQLRKLVSELTNNGPGTRP